MLARVRPEVAQTSAALGMHLQRVQTAVDLQSALLMGATTQRRRAPVR